MQADGTLSRAEARVLTAYVMGLTCMFRALSMKYLLLGRDTGRYLGALAMERRDRGFPAATEPMTMANDAQQAAVHLAKMPGEAELKDEMVRVIVGERAIPTTLQFALSQRLYSQELIRDQMF